MNEHTIFIVSTLNLRELGASPRTVAWFADLSAAIECVLNNWGDIFETTYTYTVIEEVPHGLYPRVVAEHWFKWYGNAATGNYQTCDKPAELRAVVNYGIG